METFALHFADSKSEKSGRCTNCGRFKNVYSPQGALLGTTEHVPPRRTDIVACGTCDEKPEVAR